MKGKIDKKILTAKLKLDKKVFESENRFDFQNILAEYRAVNNQKLFNTLKK